MLFETENIAFVMIHNIFDYISYILFLIVFHIIYIWNNIIYIYIAVDSRK